MSDTQHKGHTAHSTKTIDAECYYAECYIFTATLRHNVECC
jgi:hypothetical protein